MLNTIRALLRINKRQSAKEIEDKKEQERIKQLRERFSDNTEQDNTKLKEKRARVNSKWNKFKSVFGCGEQLTREEESKLIGIDCQDRFKQYREEEEKKAGAKGESIFLKDDKTKN